LATATNGHEALQVLESKPVDLVLLDFMMPEMNGYEVLEKMKGSDQLRHLPVIMISAVGEIDSVVRCIELGADDYLLKPFNPVLLRARVGASLERKRLHDQVVAQAADLATWNRTLEQRVADQLGEIERVGRLKRFLSPQIADLVISSGGDRVVDSHRREFSRAWECGAVAARGAGAAGPAVLRPARARSPFPGGPMPRHRVWTREATASTFTLLGQYSVANFSVGVDGHGATMITDPAASSSVVQTQLVVHHPCRRRACTGGCAVAAWGGLPACSSAGARRAAQSPRAQRQVVLASGRRSAFWDLSLVHSRHASASRPATVGPLRFHHDT
jgi:CheY-like chemotaxis protein